MDVVAGLDGCIAHVARLGALDFDVLIGAQPFSHSIAVLTRPGKQVSKTVDGGPIMMLSDAPISRLKLLALTLRVAESGQLLLVSEPVAQGVLHGRVA
jgi:hypothetical protein